MVSKCFKGPENIKDKTALFKMRGIKPFDYKNGGVDR